MRVFDQPRRLSMAALAFALVAMPVGATAQYAPYPSPDPAAALESNLRILAQNPYDLTALTQAGLGALAIGDAQAAIGFLARAEELAPRDGRVKAALGSALLMVEKPVDAMRLFNEATLLGADERGYAGDRALAHDLLGEQRKAHRDYALALKGSSNDETTRRYALSLGIAGEKSDALKLLDPLIRKNDQGAWRARAFVLAMNGDLPEAERIANSAAPSSLVGALGPFLRRLADLSPAQRAAAVNFGTMPATGTRLAIANPEDGFKSIQGNAGEALIPRGQPLGPVATPVLSAREARRRAKEERELAKLADRGRRAQQGLRPSAGIASALPTPRQSIPAPATTAASPPPPATGRVGRRIAAVDPSRLPPEARPAAASSTPPRVAVVTGASALPPPSSAPAPVRQAVAEPVPQAVVSTPVPQIVTAAVPPPQIATPTAPTRPTEQRVFGPPAPTSMASVEPTAAPARAAPAPVQVIDVAPGFSLKPVELAQATPATATTRPPAAPPPASPPPSQATAPSGLGGIIAGLAVESESAAALPDEAALRAARATLRRKAEADAAAKLAAEDKKKTELAAAAEAKRSPARHWVQIATGANRGALPGTFRKLKTQAPKALASESAWTSPYRASNRLLVGPFKSAAEARARVNALAKEGIAATTFSSEAGQEIARLDGK